MARSVTVDNYTPNPIIINDDVAQTIPPYTYGVQRNFSGTQTAQARLDTPASANLPLIPSVGQIALLRYTDVLLPATSGVSLTPVTIQVAGLVSIGSSGSVTILGTPTVQFAAGQSVSITGIATVSISGVPAVTISGTPTVILGAGTASVGSISAISSTVTVAGTVAISSGTVSISGTVTVGGSVSITSGTVSISGTVTIAGSVSITSGSVSITGVPNININSQSVNLNTQQPQTNLGNFVTVAPGTNNATYVVPAGTHAIGIALNGGVVTALQVQGVTTGVFYINLAGSAAFPLSGYFVSPVMSVLDTSVKITTVNGAGGNTTTYAVAILDAEGVYVFDNARQPASVFLSDSTGNAVGATSNGGTTSPALWVGTVLAPSSGIGQQASAWTMTSIAEVDNVTTTLLAANSTRRGLIVYFGHGAGLVTFQVGSAVANTNIVFQAAPGTYWEMPSPVSTALIAVTTGVNGGGAFRITEIT